MTPPVTVLVTSRSFSTGDLDLRGELEAAQVTLVTGPPDHELKVLTANTVDCRRVDRRHGTCHGRAPGRRPSAAPGGAIRRRGRRGRPRGGSKSKDQRHQHAGRQQRAVADHTVALMLCALRRVAVGDRHVRAGDWRMQRTRELGRLTVGIIGAGRIGREVATRLSGFGGTVIGHDPWVPADAMAAARIVPVTMRQLTERSDIITLHIPGDQTVVDAGWLAHVKNGVIIINTARAALVDEDALAASLADGTVAAYAADTLSSETGKGSAHVLLDEALSDRTIFTPHWAAQTVEAVDNMGRGAVDAVLAILSGQSPPNLVPASSGEAQLQ